MNRQEAMRCFKSFPIYGITAEGMSAGRSNLEVVEAMLQAGIRFVQYREKEKSGLARYNECLQLRELTRKYGAAFLIDDFVDLAMAVDADGVHIGQCGPEIGTCQHDNDPENLSAYYSRT